MNVSLTSILSSYGYGTTKTETSPEVAAALEKLAKQAAAQSASASTAGTQVSISPAALAAATATADNAKDFTTLSQEVRAALDSQYAAGTAKGSADLSEFSGRALAAMALNRDGQFTSAEKLAAKQALREQTRTSFASAAGYDSGALTSLSAQLAAQYDAMSPEEREARGWTEQFRDGNASFANRVAMPSLLDQLSSTDW